MKISLATLEKYASKEIIAKTGQGMIQDITKALTGITMDNVKMRNHSDDPAMQEDMCLSLANGYKNAPDLRMASLLNLAEIHSKVHNMINNLRIQIM
jgi:hypothetical protein